MKKILLFASALAGLFLAASCQRENLEPVGGNTVTYTVQVPEAISTKALIGEDVAAVTQLIYEVYRTEAETADDHSKAELRLYQKEATLTDGVAKVELELVNNQNFRVLFWAQVPNNGVYTTTDLKNVTLSQNLAANKENYNAFAGADYIKYGDNLAGRTITLVRPIAQLNIATTPESLVLGEGGTGQTTVDVETSEVIVDGLSTTYNVSEAKAGADAVKFEYSATDPAALTQQTLTVNGKDYQYLSMNYVGFAAAAGSNVTVDYDIVTENVGTVSNIINNVPVKANYRTNIVGNLITSMSDYTVTLDKEWAGVAGEYEIWDGETKNEPEVVDGKYIIRKASEFAWLEAPRALAYDVVLASNIDMGGNKFQGILSNGKVFDGAGYTLMNVTLDYTTPQDWSSLFVTGGGSVGSSNINVKNLTVDGAYVVADKSGDGNAAVIASYAEATLNIENVKVKNSTVNGTQSIGALVGHVTGTGDATIKNCAIDNVTLSTFDVPGESGNIGGVVGRVTGKCTIENTSISNSVINAYVNDGNQVRTVSKYIGNFYGSSASLTVTDGSINNVTINLLNDLAQTQSCLYTEYLGGWRKDGGSVSINGIEITKDQSTEDMTVNNATELADAISNAADGAVIPVSGAIDQPSLNTSGKSVTIVGMTEDAAINASTQSNYISAEGSNITFKNMTFKFPLDPYSAASGINADGGNLVFENCKFEGSAVISEGVVVYNDCEFNNVDGKYAAFVYAGNVTYNNCYFKAKNRAVKVYGDMTGLKVTYNDCTFEALEANKAAVEFDTSNTYKDGNILNDYNEVTINNATVINMGQAEHWGTEVFNLEGGYGTSGIVTVDGVTYAKAAYKGAFDAAAQKNSKSIEIRLTAEVDLGNIGTAPAFGGAATESFTINGTNKNGTNVFTPNTLKYSDTYRTYFTMENSSAKLVIKDAKMNYSSTNMGHFHNYAPKFCCPVELSAVEFNNAICVSGVKAVLNNVTINESMADHYALWIASGSDVTLENCQINATATTGRAIKIADEDAAEEMTNLSLKNVVVKSGKKAAVLVSTAYGAEINVESINIDNVVADPVNAVWVDEDYASYFDTVVVTGASKVQE